MTLDRVLRAFMRFVPGIIFASIFLTASIDAAAPGPEGKTRIAVVGLDHDHVWGLLRDIAKEPDAELVAIAETQDALVKRAKERVPPSVKFYTDYIKMLDELKPDAVIATTENDRHFEILQECAKRHIHYSTEKPMATTAKDALEMERLAESAHIKLMVNYWNAWVAPTPALQKRVAAGEVGNIQKIIVEYGHAGPKEIGVSPQFASWLYDPAKNGGGAIMDFGCYGAEWAVWLKGRPTKVYATTRKLKVSQNNSVDDDATIVLDYPDGIAILQASWDWPYGMESVQVFGPKGSLLATAEELLFRTPKDDVKTVGLYGKKISAEPLPADRSNPVRYFVNAIRNDSPIEDPVSGRLNVQVMEVLDAARKSVRTGKAEMLD
ncbi:MAG TPA: Gfo/Idh/MocA family oxidoreductase [Candidatus Dormibacteraeota bacterium]|nr:Gfo/Idh/MocA family oxidoreductase [Candidatus Dormibacteraeota bacterium]